MQFLMIGVLGCYAFKAPTVVEPHRCDAKDIAIRNRDEIATIREKLIDGEYYCDCPLCKHALTLSDKAISEIIEHAIPETEKLD